MTSYGATLMPRSLGFERYALGFDGVSKYVDCGNPVSLNLTDDFSIEVCLKTTGIVLITQPFIYKENSVWKYISLRQETSHKAQLRLYDGVNNPRVNSAAVINDGTLQHIVAIRQSGTLYIYQNTIVTSAADTTIGLTTDGDLNISRSYGVAGLTYWNGLIALVRIYKDYALNPEEVKWNRLNSHNPVRPDKLVLWLPMEEGADLVATDHSGLGNNGALLPALTPPTWERVRQWELRAEAE